MSAKQVSVGAARRVLDRLVAEGGSDPSAIIAEEGLAVLGEDEDLGAIVAAALEAHADAAERVRAGNAKAIGPIVGHVMRETKGRADGGEVTRRAAVGLVRGRQPCAAPMIGPEADRVQERRQDSRTAPRASKLISS